MIHITATYCMSDETDKALYDFGAYTALLTAAKLNRVPYAEGDESSGLPAGYNGICVHCDWPGMFALVMADIAANNGGLYHDCYGIAEADPIDIICVGDYARFFYNYDDYDTED